MVFNEQLNMSDPASLNPNPNAPPVTNNGTNGNGRPQNIPPVVIPVNPLANNYSSSTTDNAKPKGNNSRNFVRRPINKK